MSFFDPLTVAIFIGALILLLIAYDLIRGGRRSVTLSILDGLFDLFH